MTKYSESWLEEVRKNSFKNFHVRGFDYLCLKRTPELTIKIYMLQGDVASAPEVVNPHDHRYDFETTVLSGSMIDFEFIRDDRGDTFQSFDYMTPLNGGNGFKFRREERLMRMASVKLERNQKLFSKSNKLHTIAMRADQTVLLLKQMADVVPVGAPTTCWVRKGQPEPDTSGLYSKFNYDEIINRMALVTQLSGAPLEKFL